MRGPSPRVVCPHAPLLSPSPSPSTQHPFCPWTFHVSKPLTYPRVSSFSHLRQTVGVGSRVAGVSTAFLCQGLVTLQCV